MHDACSDAVQICSTPYRYGIYYIDTILIDLKAWMEEHNYDGTSDFKGKIARDNEHAAAFAREQFMKGNFN